MRYLCAIGVVCAASWPLPWALVITLMTASVRGKQVVRIVAILPT